MARKHSRAATRGKAQAGFRTIEGRWARARSVRCDRLLLALARELRRVLEVVDVVVPDELEEPVLRDEDDERLTAGVHDLVHGVRRDVDDVTPAEVPLR